jgi:RNA recognition motif-containing protein
MNIYVGNLPWTITDEALRELFAAHGQVLSARVITDRDSGRSRGFGFVEMPVEAEAQAAIAGLNGTEQDGRALNVNQARPRTDRRDRGGGGRRRY